MFDSSECDFLLWAKSLIALHHKILDFFIAIIVIIYCFDLIISIAISYCYYSNHEDEFYKIINAPHFIIFPILMINSTKKYKQINFVCVFVQA